MAGNDPQEWKKTCMVTPEGQLYIRGDFVFSCLKAGAKHTKKGRSSIQSLVVATLQVEDDVVLLNRHLPEGGEPKHNDFKAPVYLDVRGVRNKATGGANIRYRLACSPGWRCSFTILWDKTVVGREQMKAVLRDASILAGLGDGLKIGFGRFTVEKYEELPDAEEEAAAGAVEPASEDRVAPRRPKVRAVPEANLLDGVSH